MAKEIICAYGIDVDAVAGWLGSYGGENSPDDISRGLFAGEIGTPRLLRLFERYGIKTTWFIPGHSIETFPKETELVVAGRGADDADRALAVEERGADRRQAVLRAVEVEQREAARGAPEVVDPRHGLLAAVAALVQVHGGAQPVDLVDDGAVVGLETEPGDPGGDP